MKKKIACILSIILILTSINIKPVYAVDNAVQSIVHFENGVLMGYEKLLQYAGMIIDPAISATRSASQFVHDRLVALGLISDSATEEDVQQFFNDNIVQSPHSNSHHNLEYKSPLNVYIQNEMNAIMSDCGYAYLYSYNLTHSINSFDNGDVYNALRQWIIDNNTESNSLFYFLRNNTPWTIKLNNPNIGWVSTGVSGTNYYVSAYRLDNWTEYNIFTQQSSPEITYYSYDGNTKSFLSVNSIGVGSNRFMTSDINTPINNRADYGYFMSVNNNSIFKVYKSLNDLKLGSQGLSPYYLSDAYNTYKNVTGSYNTTTDNSVTYGDITNYINSFNQENGRDPTPNEIHIHINTGGGGSGGDDSGGGGSGGDSGDNTGIFDFLSKIGSVLGNLIKNLGNILAELLEGISEVITDVLGVLPNILTPLLHYVFGFLPAPVQSVIYLGIVAILILGILKFLKR